MNRALDEKTSCYVAYLDRTQTNNSQFIVYNSERIPQIMFETNDIPSLGNYLKNNRNYFKINILTPENIFNQQFEILRISYPYLEKHLKKFSKEEEKKLEQILSE